MDKLAQHIQWIWSLDAIQQIFKERKFLFPCNMDFFFDKVREIMSEDYNPTQEDLLKLKVRTYGITEHHFDRKNDIICVTDFGGSRTERRKWSYWLRHRGTTKTV